jgi:hypothetical protein
MCCMLTMLKGVYNLASSKHCSLTSVSLCWHSRPIVLHEGFLGRCCTAVLFLGIESLAQHYCATPLRAWLPIAF